MKKGNIVVFLHLVFWVFILLSINVDWTANWFDASLRPSSPAPFSVLMFAVYFYGHTFWLLPKYFSHQRWKKYLLYAAVLCFLPECLRILLYLLTISDRSIEAELFHRDSFIFGAPSALFLALNASILYRFVSVSLLRRRNQKATAAYQGVTLLSEQEANELEQQLRHQLEKEEIFLQPELTLREVAQGLGSTEKKVSYLINQHLQSNFYELINEYRVKKFKAEVLKPENKSLSIVGIALNCGFPSKSSFYRAFKSQVSMSPSEYIKQLSQP
ncbi:MAG: helix-turn-helix domain-containing protein [Bacteroidota bacterium]